MNHRLLIQATRIGIYVVVVLLTLLNHLLQRDFYNWDLVLRFYGLSIFGLLLHLGALIRLDSFFEKRPWVFATFIVDVILISTLMLTTGLNQTLFLFMYLVTIILSGLVFQMRGALLIAALTSIGFTIASWFGPEMKAMSFLFLLILNNISFFAVAGLSGYLSDQLNLFAEKLEAQNLSLRVIRRLNELIVETIPSGLMTINSASEILQFNPGAAQLFKKDQLEGRKLFEMIPELAIRVPALENLQASSRHEVLWSEGAEDFLLSVQILPQSSEFNTQTYLVVLEDLTQVRRLEFAVRQSEKMAAVGQLAAGIAHEIRNPLASISGSVELLSQSFSTEDDKKLAKIILKEIDRLNRLISEFLDFSKPEKPPSEIVDLNLILKEVLESLKISHGGSVEIEVQLSPEAKVLGHKDKLKQAFLNIVINGLQAMDKADQKQLQVRTLHDKGQVIVRIRDTGCGMSEETRKRMFEPFHTTKAKGTGLGLAITHKIIESHSARIDVDSKVGLGTEFMISFPAKTI